MHRSFRLNTVVVPLLAFAAALAVGRGADAQVKAFGISGEGVAPMGVPLPGEGSRPHWIVGVATHLGLHYGEGSVITHDIDVFDPAAGRIAGNFGSGVPFTFVGANGDKLVCEYGRDADGNFVGEYELQILEILPGGALVVEAAWVADFVVRPDLSTGRFEGVTGRWTMFAWSEPFVLGSSDPLNYGWQGIGRLQFPQGN